jgi:hypothetical protein
MHAGQDSAAKAQSVIRPLTNEPRLSRNSTGNSGSVSVRRVAGDVRPRADGAKLDWTFRKRASLNVDRWS